MANSGDAFINRTTGTFSPTSKEWGVTGDQWMQTYYQVRDGKLYLVHNDNKEQTCEENEVDIDRFLREHASTSEHPYSEIVAFLVAHRA